MRLKRAFSAAFREAVAELKRPKRGRPRKTARNWEIFHTVRQLAELGYPLSPPGATAKVAGTAAGPHRTRSGAPSGLPSVFDVAAKRMSRRRSMAQVTPEVVMTTYYAMERRLKGLEPLPGTPSTFLNSRRKR